MDAWNELDAGTQFATALRVARRLRRQLPELYSNVISVGAGFRIRRDRRRPLREICLKFVVTRKWRGPGRRAGEIPKVISAYANIGTRKVKVQIPTDVDTLGAGRFAAGLSLAAGVTVHAGAGAVQVASGSICCAVRDIDLPSRRYLLSCHHVLTGSLGRRGCAPYQQTEIRDRSGAAIAFYVGDAAKLETGGHFGFDAALARIHGDASVYVWGARPVRVASHEELLGDSPPELHLYALRTVYRGGQPVRTRRGPVRARYVSTLFDLALPYQCGGTVGLTRVIQYQADTEPGDSGSALISSDGGLHGMHFYETDQGYGLAMIAEDLFSPWLFGFQMELDSS